MSQETPLRRCDFYIGNADGCEDCELERGHDGPHSFASLTPSVNQETPLRDAMEQLIARWRDPEFWKDRGATMDSLDCAIDLEKQIALLPVASAPSTPDWSCLSEQPRCPVWHRDGYQCQLVTGHTGNHRHETRILAAWPTDEREKARLAPAGPSVAPAPSTPTQEVETTMTLPERSAAELSLALRQRAQALTGQAWEVPATVAMMIEAADLLSPTPDQVLQGDDALVKRIVADVRGAFATTRGERTVFSETVDVEEVVRFVLLRGPSVAPAPPPELPSHVADCKKCRVEAGLWKPCRNHQPRPAESRRGGEVER